MSRDTPPTPPTKNLHTDTKFPDVFLFPPTGSLHPNGGFTRTTSHEPMDLSRLKQQSSNKAITFPNASHPPGTKHANIMLLPHQSASKSEGPLTVQVHRAGRVVAPIEDHHARGGHDRFVVLEFFLFLSLALVTHISCFASTIATWKMTPRIGPGFVGEICWAAGAPSAALPNTLYARSQWYNHHRQHHYLLPKPPHVRLAGTGRKTKDTHTHRHTEPQSVRNGRM